MLVIDASSVIELLLGGHAAPVLRSRISGLRESLHAPHLLDLEVLQVLRRHAASGQLSKGRAELAIGFLQQMRIMRHPHADLASRIWALQHNFTAYDAAYLALADKIRCPLLTCDHKLSGSGLGVAVEVV